MERVEEGEIFKIGSKLPKFNLPATDGSNYTENYFSDAKLGLLVFTCNHCPYVKGSEKELYKIIEHFKSQGLKSLLVSSNDALQYPEDSFENMKLKSQNENLPCPYLYDQSQQLAKDFNAQCTPELYLFDSENKLIYHGGINDSPRDNSKITKNFLRDVLTNYFESGEIESSFTHSIGCSIKWKNN